jgi:hypothetical protein
LFQHFFDLAGVDFLKGGHGSSIMIV